MLEIDSSKIKQNVFPYIDPVYTEELREFLLEANRNLKIKKLRIIKTLEWMIKDMKWRCDQTKNLIKQYPKEYSSELTEAINLLKELSA